MCDLQIPWACDDKECPGIFHLSSYGIDESTGENIYSEFSDGDWESCDAEDVPSDEEIADAWKSYHSYVAETGDDPLRQFLVNRTRTVKHRWQARFRNWIGSSQHGVMCIGIRRRGRGDWVMPIDAPEAIKQYLELTKVSSHGAIWTSPEFKTLAAFIVAENVIKPALSRDGLTFFFDVDEEQPVAPNRIAQELKRMARAELKQTPAKGK